MRDTVASDTPSTVASTRFGSSSRAEARITPLVTTAASLAFRGEGRGCALWRAIAPERLSLFSFCGHAAARAEIAQFVLRDRLEMHLVGPVSQPQRARVGPRVGEEGVLADPGGAVCLDRTIEHPLRDVGRYHLDHRDLGPRGLVADGIHQV